MAMRSASHWRSVLTRLKGNSTFATATTPKMKPYAPASQEISPREFVRGDFVPVCVALGMIAMSVSFGLYTAMHQLRWSPNVCVRKSKRETVPELVDPEHVVEEAEHFVKDSFFRKVAHIQDYDRQHVIPNPIRGDIISRQPRAVTLKDVGVDPKPH